jgi:hypothetical protein
MHFKLRLLFICNYIHFSFRSHIQLQFSSRLILCLLEFRPTLCLRVKFNCLLSVNFPLRHMIYPPCLKSILTSVLSATELNFHMSSHPSLQFWDEISVMLQEAFEYLGV